MPCLHFNLGVSLVNWDRNVNPVLKLQKKCIQKLLVSIATPSVLRGVDFSHAMSGTLNTD